MTNSIFTKVLSLMLCLVMLAGVLTACFGETDSQNSVGTTTGAPSTTKPSTTTSATGGVADNDPEEDPVDPNVIYSASTELTDGALIYGSLANDIVIGGEVMGAMIPADVKIEAGAQSVALSVKKVEEETLDGALSNLDVHIDGIAANNTVPMLVKLGAILEAGLGETELKLYHHENGVATLMTRVESVADFAIHNQYYYDVKTGEVTIYVATFSVFTAVQATASKWEDDTVADTSWYVDHESDEEFTLEDVADFLGFRDLVDAGTTFEGKTVKLGVDIDLAGKNFDPVGYGYTYGNDSDTAFMGTFDGQGHTVYNLYQNGWDLESETGKDYTYSTAGGGLFASIENATIKNLAVSGANIIFECVDIGIVVGYTQGTCHFENIVVTDSKIANYNRATGAVVGEVCYGPYGTDVSNGYSHTFDNITVDSSVKVSSLWGSFDTLCGGVIGGKWGDATVKMTNVTVAAELDVFSDVTAAYQWYAYRRCGMLIGHTEQNSPKKALNAAANFLTCENVNVYYGDWVNYTYYQFTNQNNDKGNNYPWVRAEAGEHNRAFFNARYGNPKLTIGEEEIAINTVDLAEANNTGKATITFNQLYGGGQGVYGAADHDGVTTHDKLTKTIYINNNLSWTNLKLHYWYVNGSDRWTTVVEGVNISDDMKVADGIYKLEIPAYADGFKIEGTDANSATATTPEILMSAVEEKSTYPLIAFQLTLSINENNFVVNTGDWLYNTEVKNGLIPNAADYDVIIYDKNYVGQFETNGFGVAIVIDADGNLVKIYDGANDGKTAVYYTVSGVTAHDTLTNANYAVTAYAELENGEILIICPNDGGTNLSRTWALSLRPVNGEGYIGQKFTMTTTVNPDVHVCSDMCEVCLGCRNKDCTHTDCTSNRCNCLEISVKVDVDGFENTFVVTENNWLYNTQIDRNYYPYAAHYQVVVYDNTYTGTFTTNEYGIAVVLDADNKLVKIYDAANGDRSVVCYSIDANGNAISEIIIEAGTDNNNGDYATLAWSELEEDEKLVIFPNHKSDNSARNWAKTLCSNWELVNGATAILTATFKLPTTIYFQNNQSWENVGIQYWYDDENTMTGVLGTTTLNDGLYDVYRVVLPANVVKVAFGPADSEENVSVETPAISSLQNGYIYVVDGETVNSCEYVSGYKTIYFKNNWLWSNVKLYYWYTDTWRNADFPGESIVAFDNDGTYDYYKFIIPAYAKAFIVSGNNHDESSRREQTTDIEISGVVDGAMYMLGGYSDGCDSLDSSSEYYKRYVTTSSQNFDTYYAQYKVIYLDLTDSSGKEWKNDNARFAAYVWTTKSGVTTDTWYSMSDVDGDGIYSCWISTTYKNIIFCRMNPAYSTNSWDADGCDYLWNQTSDQTHGTNNCFKITDPWNSNGASGTWSKK